LDGEADLEEEMILAAKIGLRYDEYLKMDSYEFACWVRGYEIRMWDERVWQRFFTSVLLQPHVKKSIDPQKIIKFPHEKKIPKTERPDEAKKRHMEEVFRMWDEQEKQNKKVEGESK
jgi:hypothetical protein